jgi:hypothetical protein
MGGVPQDLATGLRDRLGLVRGVETGTYHGYGARTLARIFDHAVTIELSEQLWREARSRYAKVANLDFRCGHSADLLPEIVAEQLPTFYFLDGHWSGGPTAGETDECPVLAEVAAIAAGHEKDCIAIDDARLFAAPPPSPHDPDQWPTLMELTDAIRAARPSHHVTVLADLVIAVPSEAKPVVDQFGQRCAEESQSRFGIPERLAGLARRLREGG